MSARLAPAARRSVIPLPALIAKDRQTGEAVGGLHGLLAWALLAVVVLHVAGALYHGVVKRDGVLGRMLPSARQG